MPASAVCSPVAVTRRRRLPVPLSEPPITLLPVVFSTGLDSPVISASSTSERPSTTSPSAGMPGPRPHQHKVAAAQITYCYLFDCAVGADAVGCVRHQLSQLIERARRLAHTAHLEPMAKQHHVDQQCHLPKETAVRVDEDHGEAVDKGHGNRQRNQQHHAWLAADDLRHGHLQKRNAAVRKITMANSGATHSLPGNWGISKPNSSWIMGL